jgi:hypothetical protein
MSSDDLLDLKPVDLEKTNTIIVSKVKARYKRELLKCEQRVRALRANHSYGIEFGLDTLPLKFDVKDDGSVEFIP